MRTHRLFVEQSLSANSELILDKAASHYLGTVLRAKQGQLVSLFNGQGGEYQGVVLSATKKQIIVKLETFNPTNRMPERVVHLVAGVIKGDRMDWLIQKATELGVASIQPVMTEYTDIKLSLERMQKKVQHWQKIAISACEQSERNLIPKVSMIKALSECYGQRHRDCETQWIVLDPNAEEGLLSVCAKIGQNVCVFVGPEGGLSKTDLAHLTGREVLPAHLGDRILRAETAPLAALSCLLL